MGKPSTKAKRIFDFVLAQANLSPKRLIAAAILKKNASLPKFIRIML